MVHAWGERLDGPVVFEDDESGVVGPLGIGGLAHKEAPLGALGKIRSDLAQEFDLVRIELRLTRLSVEASTPHVSPVGVRNATSSS
jgi:hypothetical protein